MAILLGLLIIVSIIAILLNGIVPHMPELTVPNLEPIPPEELWYLIKLIAFGIILLFYIIPYSMQYAIELYYKFDDWLEEWLEN
jgi:hypothetical protein